MVRWVRGGLCRMHGGYWECCHKYLVSSLCSTTRNSIGGKIFNKNTFSSIHYKPDNLTEMVSTKKKKNPSMV